MYPKFMISLEQSVQRREESFAKYAKMGIEDITWWHATNGKEDPLDHFPIDKNKKQKIKLNAFVSCRFNRFYSLSEYGCAFSHMSIYEHMVKNNIPYALILEDDVYPGNEIIDLIRHAPEVMAKHDIDILFLDYIDKLKTFNDTTVTECGVDLMRIGVPGFDWLFNRRKVVYNASAYIITLSTAKKFLDIGLPIRMPADILTGLISFNKLKAYRTKNLYMHNDQKDTTILHHYEMQENEREGLRLLALKFKLFLKKLTGKM